MILTKILTQLRRDFQGQYTCEFCNYVDIDKGLDSYDDRYFHDNVIPNMRCGNFGKSTLSEGGTIKQTPTKYPEGFQV